MSTPTTEGSSPPPTTAFCEFVSRNSIATGGDSSSSHGISDKPTPHTTSVKSASTRSFSTTSLSKYTFPPIDAVQTSAREPVTCPLEGMTGEELPLSLCSQRRKCVLGSFDDIDNSVSRIQTETGRRDQRRAHEHSRRAGVLFESSAHSPAVRADDDTAADTLTSSRVTEITAPLLLEGTSCLAFAANLSKTSPVSRLPFADTRPRDVTTNSCDTASPTPAPEDGPCHQNGANQGCRLSSENVSAGISCGHHTSRVPPRIGSALRLAQRAVSGFCIEGRRRPQQVRYSREGPKPTSFRKRGELPQRESLAESSPLTASRGSSRSSVSVASPSSLKECVCRPTTAYRETPHGEEAGYFQKPASPRKFSSSRWEKARLNETTSSRVEDVYLQQAFKQRSAPGAKNPEHQYTPIPQRRPVNTSCYGAPPQKVSYEDDREEKFPLQENLMLGRRGEIRKTLIPGEQPPLSSSAADMRRHAHNSESFFLRRQRRRSGEHAAFVLNELQQLQRLFGKKLGAKSVFRKKSLQHRFRQAKSALQQLLSSSDTEGATSCKKRSILKVRSEMSNRASSSGSSPAPYARPSTPLRSTTSRLEAAGAQKNITQTSGDVPDVRNGDIVEQSPLLPSRQTAFTSGETRAPHSRQEQPDSATPGLAQGFTSVDSRGERACMAGTLQSEASPAAVAVGTEQAKAAPQPVLCPDEGVSPKNSRRRHAQDVRTTEDRAEESNVLEGNASCIEADKALAYSLCQRDSPLLYNSCNREDFTDSSTTGEAVTRGCRRRHYETHEMPGSIDATLTEEGQRGGGGVAPSSEKSRSSQGRTGDPRSPGICNDTGIHRPARDRRNSRHHSSFTVSHAEPPQRSEHSDSKRDTRDHGGVPNGHSQNGSDKIHQMWVSSHNPKKSPTTVSGSSKHKERPLSATVKYNKTFRSLRDRRRRKVVRFRVRRRRYRLCGIRQLSRGSRHPGSPALKLVSETYGSGVIAPRQQRVYHDGTFPCHILQVDVDQNSFSWETTSMRSTDFGVTVSPSMERGKPRTKAPSQPASCPPKRLTTNDGDATASSVLSSRRHTPKEKRTHSTNALSKATECNSAQHSQTFMKGNENDETGNTSDIHQPHQSTTKVQGATRRDEAAQHEDVSASTVEAGLVQAMCKFVRRKLVEERRKKDELEDEDAVSHLRVSALHQCVAKNAYSWPAEACEGAQPGLLLASCLGIMACYGGGGAFRDLCKMFLTPTTEQTQKGESTSAQKIGCSEAAEGEVSQVAAESGSHDVVLPRQTAEALDRKTSVPPGGRTAERAATRFAQKEHKQQQHRNHAIDGMQEDCEQLGNPPRSFQQKPTRKKMARCKTDGVTCSHSPHPHRTASRPTSHEGKGIRWELLRTAKRAARQREREESALMDPPATGHRNNSRGNVQGDAIREERQKCTVSPLHLVPDTRLSSNSGARCSSFVPPESDNAVGIYQSNNHIVEVPSLHLSASQTQPVTSPQDPLHEQACSAKKRPQNYVSAHHDCTPPTDDNNTSAEELPSFEDIFNVPDLIPAEWYEEAERSGRAGDANTLKPAVAQSNTFVAKTFKEAGQWVLEPETVAMSYDAPGDKDSFQPGFFSMMLSEKKCSTPSDASLDKAAASDHHLSQLPAFWNVPDDLVKLIDSVPGGSPSALRPPCALRLLPTSSSSSSPSLGSTPRSSLHNSPTSSIPSSSSSSSSSASSLSRAPSAAGSPLAEERSADKAVAPRPKREPSASNCSFGMLTHEQHSPAGMRWIFESSSEYDEDSGDVDSSNSESDHLEALTCKNQEYGGNQICQHVVGDGCGTPTGTTLSYTGGVGFFQRALAHEGVRNRLSQPLPEFISLCSRKNSSSPDQRQNTIKAKGNLCGCRSRTRPSTRVLAPDRAKRNRKHRRRRRRAECLKQRLAALHRDNLSHEEYMGQFARRMRLNAVHKVFCIEFTKAERCSLPYTVRSGDVSIDTHGTVQSAAQNNALTSLWFASVEGSPFSQPEAVDDDGRLCAKEKHTAALCKASATPSVLTIEGCIADQLRRRGWVMNRLLSDSHFFDLKWKLSDVEEDYRSLRREQFFNHFQNNRVITTKGGLARSLRRLAVEEQVQVDLFFPRCYHLSSLDECSDFLLDYSRCEALTVLLAYLRCYQATPDEFHTVMVSEPLPSNSVRRSAALLLWMAYHIASVWLHELNPDLYLDRTESIEQRGRLDPQRLEVFASHAWHFRCQTRGFLREWHGIAQCGKALNATVDSGEISEDDGAVSVVKERKLYRWRGKNISRAPLGSQVLRLLKQLQTWWPLWQLERGKVNLNNLAASEEAFGIHDEDIRSDERAHETGQQSRGNPKNGVGSTNRDPCWKQHNVWIMKPSSNSKASGIHCLNNPWEILKAGRGLSDRLIQKYVERPLLLPCRRKFDMRQWVLVRSFDPLLVYVFSTLYLRLCSETYDLRDLQNRFRHVSNRHLNKLNSDAQEGGNTVTTKDINAYPSGCGTSHGINSAAGGLDSCRPSDELEAMLAQRTGNPHFFQDNVMPQIRQIVLQTVRAARPSVVSRPNSFELYGFDILLDEACRAWLIEVNLSPACAASAEWQQEMVKQMTGELLDLLFRSDGSGAHYKQHVNSTAAGHWTLVFDESVDPSEAMHAFPPLEPADERLAAGCTQAGDNPFLQFYSQPTHKRRGSVFAPRAAGGIAGLYPLSARGEDKHKISLLVGSAAAGWDKMVVVGEHLSRQAEAALNAWCRFTEAKSRIIGWWRRNAWKRRAARRKKLALYDDIEVDYFFRAL